MSKICVFYRKRVENFVRNHENYEQNKKTNKEQVIILGELMQDL